MKTAALAAEAQSLEQLQTAVERDFSKNLLVSHGLFRSPYPFGSHLFCEVDTSNLPETKSWCDGKSELVIRVIPNARDHQSTRKSNDPIMDEAGSAGTSQSEGHVTNGSLEQSTALQVLGALHREATLYPASFESLVQALQNVQCSSFTLKDLIWESGKVKPDEDCRDDLDSRMDKLCLGISHPNIVPLQGAFSGKENLYLMFPPAPYTLKSILHFSPNALGDEWHVRLLIYEILAGLAHCHLSGVVLGNINPSNVLLSSSMWCWLTGFTGLRAELIPPVVASKAYVEPRDVILKEPVLSHELDWKSQFKRWWRGELSNLDYLLLLNRLAGRRWGDRCFHTVMPWVIDFSVKPDEQNDVGWRDLTKSKWRLAKGDEQLDFTYASAETPHHVSDECLSELAVCIYKGRRLPLLVLRRVVRSVYEPNEYPGNMQRLYQWTPDECIPEFYSDAKVFHSIHSGMSDLAVPSWAKDAEDFIVLHRSALESDRVSRQLHHWIDLTFGYKLSGEAAVSAKNVPLSTSGPMVPRSSGRRQLFFKPHPMRRIDSSKLKTRARSKITPLEQLEESGAFCESARYLSPWYGALSPSAGNGEVSAGSTNVVDMPSSAHTATLGACKAVLRNVIDADQKLWDSLLTTFQVEQDDEELSYQNFVAWKTEAGVSKSMEESVSNDIFAVGCLIAEVYLRKPLFDPTSAAAWSATGVLPPMINQLPPHVRVLVETTLVTDFRRRPTAEKLLDSPFFPSAVRLAYIFLSSFHLLTSKLDRLQYAAKMAQGSAFLLMGPVAAELCAPACLSLLVPPYQDLDPMAVTILIKSLLQALKQNTSKRLLVPTIQSILQNNEAVQLKVGFLVSSFVRNLRRIVGTSFYLQHIHTSILLNVLQSPDSQQAAAASAVLVDTCQELGLSISLHQTILPLMQSLGRDITVHGIEALVDIALGSGEKFGEHAIIKHWLPPLRSIVMLGGESSSTEKTGPAHSWRLLAAVDAMAVVDRLISILSPSSVITEILQEPNNIYLKLLQRKTLSHTLLQCAANAVASVCNHVGSEATLIHVIPQFKLLFDDLAFGGDLNSRESKSSSPGLTGDFETAAASSLERTTDDRFYLVHILYPALASLLGIERVRQSLPTWLLLEQGLSKKFDWKWTEMGAPQSRSSESLSFVEDTIADAVPDFSPANLLLNGVGWSIPQSEAGKWSKSHTSRADFVDKHRLKAVPESGATEEPWFWVPFHNDSWGGAESFSRIGAAHSITKDEQSWKLKATVVHSWRAHSGSMRTSRIGDDESAIFTGGGRGKSVVRKWDLSTTKCVMEYTGHEEAVNDICILQGYERVASCDGTLHIWNSETGKCLAMLAETSGVAAPSTASLEGRTVLSSDATDVTMSNGIFSAGNLYTFMHFMEAERRFVVGTANGCLRFIDPVLGRQLFSWRCEPSEASLSSFISAITSPGSYEDNSSMSSSWIAIGFSSGHCSLLDFRSGSVIAHWRAHATAITKLAPLEENYLISSSLDRTLSVWDLRRSWPLQPQIFQGHTDGVTSFAVWGSNILSAAGNKIGVSSFSKLFHGQSKQIVNPRKIYTLDRSSRNLSVINTISVLPFSRQFVIGTEDGFLKICV